MKFEPYWTVKKVATYPKEWKVVPSYPAHEINNPAHYFEKVDDAQREADQRNRFIIKP